MRMVWKEIEEGGEHSRSKKNGKSLLGLGKENNKNQEQTEKKVSLKRLLKKKSERNKSGNKAGCNSGGRLIIGEEKLKKKEKKSHSL